MIQYTKYASDTKNRSRDLAWMHTRLSFILAICVLPVTVYFFLTGFLNNAPDSLEMGYLTFVLMAAFFVFCLITRSKVKKAVTKNFEKFSKDGKIDFTIEKIDEDTLECTRLTDEESFQIHRADIKCIKYLKFTNVIVLKDKRTIDIPNRVNIDELISFLY